MRKANKGSFKWKLIAILSMCYEMSYECLNVLDTSRRSAINKICELKKEGIITVNNISGIKTIRLAPTESAALYASTTYADALADIEEQRNKNYASHSTYSHIKRRHKLSEMIAISMSSGISVLPNEKPMLGYDKFNESTCCAYTAREMKSWSTLEEKMQNSTVFTGMIVTPWQVYTTYGYHSRYQEWSRKGEIKAYTFTNYVLTNHDYKGSHTPHAIMLLKSYTLAIDILENSGRKTEVISGFNTIETVYDRIHLIPLDSNGTKTLKLLTIKDYNKELSGQIFEKSMIVNNESDHYSVDCDATYEAETSEGKKVRVYIMLGFDGEVKRLKGFKAAALSQNGIYQIICHTYQAEIYKQYYKDAVTVISGEAYDKLIEGVF